MSTFRASGRGFDDPVAGAVLGHDESGDPLDWAGDLLDQTEPAYSGIITAAWKASGLGFDLSDLATARTVVERARRCHADQVHGEYLRVLKNEKRRERLQHTPVVYYMRVGNRVKIGFTTNLTARVSQVMPEEVLAIEPGGRLLEDVRHRQFAALRVTREWFRFEGPLAAHVSSLAESAA